jgi:sugar phosphate permease
MHSETTSGSTLTRWFRIMPIVFLLYTIAYFDRVNIGMALPGISADLHLSPSQGGFAAGVFFWGYLLSFLAAGRLAPRFGAKRVILCALIGWGCFAMASGFAHTYLQLVAMRFMLGLCEGPVWTSLSLLLSQWFARAERGRAFGLWNLSIPFGALLSGPISGLVLTYTNWHVMLMIEGLPAWIWAVVWWRTIPKSVDAASWLSADERAALAGKLAAEQAEFTALRAATDWRGMFRQPAVWLLLVAFSLNNMVNYGFTLWLPTVLKTISDSEIGHVGLLSALPYIASIAGIVFVTYSSDRFHERRLHAAIPLILVGALLYFGSQAGSRSITVDLVAFTLIGFFMFMTLPLISALTTDILPREWSIPAIAFTGGIGNLFGGFVGPVLVGRLKEIGGDFSLAFAVLGVLGVLGGLSVLAVRRPTVHQLREDRKGEVAAAVHPAAGYRGRSAEENRSHFR